MKNIGVVGYKGELGSLLVQKSNFFVLDCDITNLLSIEKALKYSTTLDVIVNCAGISSIDECEKDYDKAIKVNVRGLSNLHKMFGERVLNISSDHVFSGNSYFLPKENTKVSPINNYGWSKVGAEAVSNTHGGKIIRLSRTVSLTDGDIFSYWVDVGCEKKIYVPSFLYRNYIHKEFAVNGIEYFANNYDNMPSVVNYAGLHSTDMYAFIWRLVAGLGRNVDLVKKRKEEYSGLSPRPKHGGFKVDLARELGFPMYPIEDTINKLVEEYNA